jgi:hypothetical protein
MFEKLNLLYMIGSFFIGMLFVYAFKPKYEVVFKFPNPYNIDTTVYSDSNGQCYKYSMKEVSCTLKDAKVEPQPVVEEMSVK